MLSRYFRDSDRECSWTLSYVWFLSLAGSTEVNAQHQPRYELLRYVYMSRCLQTTDASWITQVPHLQGYDHGVYYATSVHWSFMQRGTLETIDVFWKWYSMYMGTLYCPLCTISRTYFGLILHFHLYDCRRHSSSTALNFFRKFTKQDFVSYCGTRAQAVQ